MHLDAKAFKIDENSRLNSPQLLKFLCKEIIATKRFSKVSRKVANKWNRKEPWKLVYYFESYQKKILNEQDLIRSKSILRRKFLYKEKRPQKWLLLIFPTHRNISRHTIFPLSVFTSSSHFHFHFFHPLIFSDIRNISKISDAQASRCGKVMAFSFHFPIKFRIEGCWHWFEQKKTSDENYK